MCDDKFSLAVAATIVSFIIFCGVALYEAFGAEPVAPWVRIAYIISATACVLGSVITVVLYNDRECKRAN